MQEHKQKIKEEHNNYCSKFSQGQLPQAQLSQSTTISKHNYLKMLENYGELEGFALEFVHSRKNK